jgi:hypothetical protein
MEGAAVHPVGIGATRTPDLYAGVTEPFRYGNDDTTYRLAGTFLSGGGLVEDWGCGAGWAREFIAAPYRGVDGCWSRFADEQVDLSTYRSSVPRIFMRHVLEHNWDWRVILENLLCSFTERAMLVLFLPPGPADKNVSASDHSDESEWPGLILCEPDLDAIIASHPDIKVSHIDLRVQTAPLNFERVYFMEKVQ